MKIALIGNPNCGKTTLFNVLTNSKSRTANFPGVTVERKDGFIQNDKNLILTDLPGIYSLSPYSPEEKVAVEFLEKEKPDLIINIVDISNLGRNLYLTLQLSEYNIPIIVALNFWDEVKKKGIEIDISKLEKMLFCKCIPISASKKTGVNNLIKEIKKPQKPIINKNIVKKGETYEETAGKRYDYIEKVLRLCVKKTILKKSFNVDSFLTHPIFSYFFFAIFSGFMFFSAFGPFGTLLTDLTEYLLESTNQYIKIFLEVINVNTHFIDFITQGILKGIFEVLKFVPVFIILFFFLSVLEDSGYMARIAFISDYLLSKIGLSGKSIIPFLLGYGCTVPAIMSAKTINKEKERKMTITLLPFIPCSAKAPVFLAIAHTLEKNRFLFLFFVYTLSLSAVFLIGFVFTKKSSYRCDSFIMELPPYRIVKMKNIYLNIKEKTSDFIKKVFSVIFIFSVITYLLKILTPSFSFTKNTTESILFLISEKLTFIFKPLGIGNWQIVSSFLCGISAKEAVLSTLTLLSGNENVFELFTFPQKISFIIFFMFYTPCIASLSTVKKEEGLKTAAVMAVSQGVFAWCCAFVLYKLFGFIS